MVDEGTREQFSIDKMEGQGAEWWKMKLKYDEDQVMEGCAIQQVRATSEQFFQVERINGDKTSLHTQHISSQ